MASLAIKVQAPVILHALIVLAVYPLLVAIITFSCLKMGLVKVMRDYMAFQAGGCFFIIREIPIINLSMP